MSIEPHNNKGTGSVIFGLSTAIATFLTIICCIQTILGLPGLLNMRNIFGNESQFKIQTTRIDPAKKINNDKSFQLKKHRCDSTKAVWEKMKSDAAKRKIIPIQEESDSTQNENQDGVEEANISNQ